MEHRNIVITKSSNSNNHHHQRRTKRRTSKHQQVIPLSLDKNCPVKSVTYTDPNANSMRRHSTEHFFFFSWRKRWSQWFSSCGSERLIPIKTKPISIFIEKRNRTKSENDLSKRANAGDQEEKKNLPITNSSLAIGSNSIEHSTEKTLAQTSSHQHHHRQSIEKVNNSNSVLYRDTSRRYSNPFSSSTRYGGEEGGGGQDQSRTSIAALSSPTRSSQQQHTTHSKQPLSRSADRLNSKSTRRELRYEEHNDYIPPAAKLNSIQCHPTIDHYARTLNQSSSAYFSSTHRRSQIEVYQLTTPTKHSILPRPYSSNIPLTTNYTRHIPIRYSSTIDHIPTMSRISPEKSETYGKLSDCHSPLTPVENSSVKAPRRIESNYSQFPLAQQEPVYANTQSLYDNILYPQSTLKVSNRLDRTDQEKKSCASQTQLTWTMATFSSFVDLENQSIIIPQPDPTTLYSIVRHHQTELPPSASLATIEHIKRTSPSLQYIDDTTSISRSPYPSSPIPSKSLMVEKRDGSFQTLLTIAPTQDLDVNKSNPLPESTPSPVSTGSSSTTDHHHHHHRHRKHKSRSNSHRTNISTRDVGLQVNIQTVKKITFSSERSDDSSLTTSTSSPPTVKSLREFKHIQTNTEPVSFKHDQSTSYESNIHLISSSSQTLTSPTDSDRQTKSAQTPLKSLRDQSSETNHQGLFVCDLSSFLKNGLEDITSPINKPKS